MDALDGCLGDDGMDHLCPWRRGRGHLGCAVFPVVNHSGVVDRAHSPMDLAR